MLTLRKVVRLDLKFYHILNEIFFFFLHKEIEAC